MRLNNQPGIFLYFVDKGNNTFVKNGWNKWENKLVLIGRTISKAWVFINEEFKRSSELEKRQQALAPSCLAIKGVFQV